MNNTKRERSLLLISPLHRANRQLSIYLESHCQRLGVASSEAHLLSYVQAYGPCPIRELIRVFGYKAPTMTSMLDRLERKSLVLRRLNPADRRSVVVAITPAGSGVAREAHVEVEALDRDIRGRVAAEDLEGFRKVIAAIAEATGVDVRQDDQGASPQPRRKDR